MPSYKLLAADQKEYGPVSADKVRQWIAQGRANARTQMQAVGSAGWKPLSEFPEFADALRPVASTGARPSPAEKAQPAAAPPKASGLAIASLVLGCLGLLTCGITSLVGLVLGIIALTRINKSQGRLGGKGVAMAGTIVSAAFLLLVPIPTAMLLPALGKARQKAGSIQCVNSVKQLNLGLLMYSGEHKDLFPSGTNWCDAIKPYMKDDQAFLCPKGKPGERCHFAFNARLAGKELKDLQSPATTVLIFETDGGWNVSGGPELLPANPRHSTIHVVGFADGHVELTRPDLIEKLRWEP
jgi:hypothetical protein